MGWVRMLQQVPSRYPQFLKIACILLGLLVTGCQSFSFVKSGQARAWHLQERWCRSLSKEPSSYRLGVEMHSSVLRVKERLFVATQAGHVWALQEKDGGFLWKEALKNPIVQKPVYLPLGGEELVVVVDAAGIVSALAAQTGRVVWSYALPDPAAGYPIVQDQNVYLLSTQGVLVCLEGTTGKKRWEYERKAPSVVGSGIRVRGTSSPLVEQGFLYVGFPDGYVVKLETESGVEKWAREVITLEHPIAHIYAPVMLGNQLIISTHGAGVKSVTASTGEVRWTVEPKQTEKHVFLGQAVVDLRTQRAYVPTSPSGWLCLRADGTSCGDYSLPGKMPSAPQQLPWGLLWGVGDKGWVMTEEKSGSPLFLRAVLGGVAETPTVVANTLYEQSRYDRLCVYDLVLSSP